MGFYSTLNEEFNALLHSWNKSTLARYKYNSQSFFRIYFTEIWFFRMSIPPKINFNGLNVPKDNFTKYPYDQKPFFRIHFAKSILPEWCKIQKYLLKNSVCEEIPKTVSKFWSDPEEPLNKLPIKEIDTPE